MKNGKDLLQSKTFWAAAFTLAAALTGLTIDIDALSGAVVLIVGFVATITGLIFRETPIDGVAGIKTNHLIVKMRKFQ